MVRSERSSLHPRLTVVRGVEDESVVQLVSVGQGLDDSLHRHVDRLEGL